jgi:hypothetical protein
MNLAGLLTGGVIETVGKVVDDLVTTDKERMQLALQDKELDQRGDLAQIDVNKAEAQSAHLFVAGWRPAAGWVCVAALALAYIPKSLVLTMLWTWQAIVLVHAWSGGQPVPVLPTFPDLGITDILGLLGAMLGVGWMRHRETLAGVARSGLPAPAAPRASHVQEEAP